MRVYHSSTFQSRVKPRDPLLLLPGLPKAHWGYMHAHPQMGTLTVVIWLAFGEKRWHVLANVVPFLLLQTSSWSMGLLLVKAEATIAGSFQRTLSALALSEDLKLMYNLQSYNLTFQVQYLNMDHYIHLHYGLYYRSLFSCVSPSEFRWAVMSFGTNLVEWAPTYPPNFLSSSLNFLDNRRVHVYRRMGEVRTERGEGVADLVRNCVLLISPPL
jgi:hypothetical protein